MAQRLGNTAPQKRRRGMSDLTGPGFELQTSAPIALSYNRAKQTYYYHADVVLPDYQDFLLIAAVKLIL